MHKSVEKILKPLLASKVRMKMLAFFFAHPTEEFFVRELTRILEEQINSIRRELESLQKIGFFSSRQKSGKKFFRLNPQFIFYKEFFSLFHKINSRAVEIAENVKKMGKIELLVLTGSFIGKADKTVIDMLLVGEIFTAKLEKYIAKDLEHDQEVRFSIVSKSDFLQRITTNDHILKSLLSHPENIIPINTFSENFSVIWG